MLTKDYALQDYTIKFKHKELTPIRGIPNLDAILRLFREVKQNAQSIPTKLGGGQLGYLALVLKQADYNNIAISRPFNRPTDPGTFQMPTVSSRASRSSSTLPTTVTAVDIANAKALHEERERLYWQCQGVEQALRNQIEQAIETDYLQALRNSTTEMLDSSIPDIIKYLQDTYGRITEQELSDREEALKKYVYDTSSPVDMVFNKINWFQDLCGLCANTKTDRQLVQIAYIIFNKTRVFMDSLLKWNKKDTDEKTYDNFKIHMRRAYQALREVGALTIEDSSINQANLIKELSSQQEKMADDIKTSMQSNILDAMMLMQNPTQVPSLTEDTSSISSHTANSTITNHSIDSLLTIIKGLESKMDNFSKQALRTNQLYSQNTDTINPKTGKEWKRYCWSCGCCPHASKNCPIKKQGHQDQATFKNRMGGSDEKCYPVKK